MSNIKEFKTLEELMQYVSKQADKVDKADMEYNKQESALEAVRAGALIIGTIDKQGSVSFAADPVVHSDATAARAECKRLAQRNPGKAFVFVKLIGAEMVPTNSISI
jgi:transaldolase